MPTPYTRFVFPLTLLATALLLAGCASFVNMQKADRDAGYTTQDYHDALAPRPIPDSEEGKDGQTVGVPPLQPYVTGAAGAGAYKPMPIVSLDVQGQYALRTLFYELAQKGGFDLELDPRITGSVYFRAQERPLDEVLERVASIAGLRYTFNDNVLRVELDTPYNKVYKLDYLNYVRAAQSNISTDISVVSTEGGTDTGSDFSVTSATESNFWEELDSAMAQILGTPGAQILRTSADPTLEGQLETVQAEPIGASQAPDVLLQIGSLPVSGGGASENVASRYSVNKQAGLVNVYATERQHKEVSAYLNMLRTAMTAQVLIEAKILEVALVDQYQTGVDWSLLGEAPGDQGQVTGDFGGGSLLEFPSNFPITGGNSGLRSIIGYTTQNFNVFVQALSTFGTVRGLASPRLSVLNNQTAVLNVVRNVVYFETDIQTQQGTQESPGDTVTVDSTIKTVPEGILVNVMPSINLDDRTVSLSIRPSITKISSYKNDPAVDYLSRTILAQDRDAGAFESRIPELNVQEVDSVIKVRSGQAIVIGGLLQDKVESQKSGLPGLHELPVAGAAFGHNQNYVKKTELVILLRATILDDPGDSLHETDRDLYRAFARDRRPWAL